MLSLPLLVVMAAVGLFVMRLAWRGLPGVERLGSFRLAVAILTGIAAALLVVLVYFAIGGTGD